MNAGGGDTPVGALIFTQTGSLVTLLLSGSWSSLAVAVGEKKAGLEADGEILLLEDSWDLIRVICLLLDKAVSSKSLTRASSDLLCRSRTWRWLDTCLRVRV